MPPLALLLALALPVRCRVGPDHMQALVALLLATLAGQAHAAAAPTGLLCNFQKSPALGVTAHPRFSWIVPAGSEPEHSQIAYELTVTAGGKVIWASGKVASNGSTNEPYTGPPLQGGTTYNWTVTTTTTAAGSAAAAEQQSATSAPAVFVTALLEGWSTAAKFISLVPACVQSGAVAPQVNCSWFGYYRKVVHVPAGVVSASAFITAQSWGIFENMLANYKLYIEGELVGLGPGRGEASVWGGQNTFHSTPIDALDLTSQLAAVGGRNVTLAIEAYHHGGPTGPQPIMQLNLVLASGENTTVVTDASWVSLFYSLKKCC